MDDGSLLSQARSLVDSDLLPGVSFAVMRGREVVDSGCVGWADREQQVPLREDHIFRAFSNTKLATTCAALLLLEAGHFGLDDPVAQWIPALGAMRVLRPGAQSLDDTEPAATAITIGHLFTHTAGFTTGVFDPGTLLYEAYHARGVRSPDVSLAGAMDLLGALPLAFHPGTAWEYSNATDVLARLVEVVSGQRFGDFLQQRVFGPLGMVDTGFVLRPAQQQRFTALYGAADPAHPLGRGLARLSDVPYAGAWQREFARQSGSGGLFTTRADWLALLRALLPGGPGLLKPETVALMRRNHLPPGMHLRFSVGGDVPGMGHGLAGAVTLAPSALADDDAVGELQWGGLAGTHWWIAPRAGLAGVLMTHRMLAFWHPFWFAFKRQAHALHSAAPG